MQSGPVRSAGFIVYRRASSAGAPVEFLLLQSHGRKNWGAPKGHVEAGEDLYAAAVRETAEEAGVHAAADLDIHENFTVEMNYTVSNLREGFNRPKVVTYWLGKLRDPRTARVTLSEEHVAFKWLDLEAACELAQRGCMRTCLRQCQEHIMAHDTTD